MWFDPWPRRHNASFWAVGPTTLKSAAIEEVEQKPSEWFLPNDDLDASLFCKFRPMQLSYLLRWPKLPREGGSQAPIELLLSEHNDRHYERLEMRLCNRQANYPDCPCQIQGNCPEHFMAVMVQQQGYVRSIPLDLIEIFDVKIAKTS